MEKVVQEFRVIETEDGYRIEIKGDKERMKSFMHGWRPWKHWKQHGRRRWGRHYGYGPMSWMRAMCFGGPWDFESEADEPEEEGEVE
jgi:hypothetical protein